MIASGSPHLLGALKIRGALFYTAHSRGADLEGSIGGRKDAWEWVWHHPRFMVKRI
jgi:hypothetical protein